MVNRANSSAAMRCPPVKPIFNLFRHFSRRRAFLWSSIFTSRSKKVRIKLWDIIIADHAASLSCTHPACDRFSKVRTSTRHLWIGLFRFGSSRFWSIIFHPLLVWTFIISSGSLCVMTSWRKTSLFKIVFFASSHIADFCQPGTINFTLNHVRVWSTVWKQRNREDTGSLEDISSVLAHSSLAHLTLIIIKLSITAASATPFTTVPRACKALH